MPRRSILSAAERESLLALPDYLMDPFKVRGVLQD